MKRKLPLYRSPGGPGSGRGLHPAAFAAGRSDQGRECFIILNADGSERSQTVSNWVHSDAGLSGFADATTLQNITNLKGEWRLGQSGGSLTFEGSGSDVYYQGTTDKTRP